MACSDLWGIYELVTRVLKEVYIYIIYILILRQELTIISSYLVAT